MSDYLWDKRGEPDAEVERLESMLGAFAHRPRPLELPAEAAAPEPAPARVLPFAPRPRAPRAFAPAALAAAAALLVASVLVASLVLRARVADGGGPSAALATPRPTPDARGGEGAAPREAGPGALGEPARVARVEGGGVRVKEEKAAVESLPRAGRRRKGAQVAAAPGQRRAVDAKPTPADAGAAGGLTLEAMGTRAGASSLVESARLMTKEQLVYALRLTGAKLRDVRQRAQKAEARP